MRALAFPVLALLSLPGFADDYLQLYRSGGWPEQREHFHAALAAAQQRYRANLPPAIYQALVNNSNQRFAAQAMGLRHAHYAEEIKTDSKAYVAEMDRFTEALDWMRARTDDHPKA